MGRTVDLEDPKYRGMTKEQITQKKEEDTREALKKFGVFLKDKHMDGYRYEPKRAEDKLLKPWQKDVWADFPETKSDVTAESWRNDDCLFEVQNGIAYITLNRPEANNAMNDGISSGLNDAVSILQRRPDIRVAVLTGNGRMFCAGGDPKSFQAAQAGAGVIGGDGGGVSGPPAGPSIASAAQQIHGNKSSALSFAKMLYDFAALPQFTICCANGSAMGGGFGLLCICDMVVAVKTAHFVLSEVKLGVIPATISPHVIGKIGVSNSKRLFCTAENCNMRTAKDIGLVQVIVDDIGQFPKVIKEVCQKVQTCGPGAIAASKRAMINCMHQPMSESLLKWTAQEHGRIRGLEEAESGAKALQAGQKPPWMDIAINVKDV